MTAKSGRSIPPFGDRAQRRIGLLGGSFNPAHEGHLHLSREALKRLGLDEVWWLVSPQNPLKCEADMAPLAVRLEGAARMAAHPHIVATDVERRLGTTRTALTLTRLTRRYPKTTFIWLMGADNLAQMPKWWHWTRIFEAVRVAVFDRSPYSYGALAGAAAQRYRRARTSREGALRNRTAPAWTYIAMRRHPASATALRTAQKH